MNYHNLNELIQNSRSSRRFFCSLPVRIQMQLHEYHDFITSAQELHTMAYAAQQNVHMELLGGETPPNFV